MIKVGIGSMSESKWENDSKLAQGVHFFFEKLQPLKKKEKRFSIFYHKNRNTYQFSFVIKNDFRNMSDCGNFRFENSLKRKNTSLHFSSNVGIP